MEIIQRKPLHFYVANLGSEIQRIFSWKEKKDENAARNAYDRALGIMGTIRDFRNSSANTEMDILQEALEDLISGSKNYQLDREQMSSYFNPFALRILNNL